LEEDQQIAEQKAEEYLYQNQEYFKFEEDSPELLRIREILLDTILPSPLPRCSNSCPARINTFKPYRQPKKLSELPIDQLSSIGIQVRLLAGPPTAVKISSLEIAKNKERIIEENERK
jgi:hypothetical protein